jgi:peptidoglycan hydrolase-like protein with peptidoglycan-binding domain
VVKPFHRRWLRLGLATLGSLSFCWALGWSLSTQSLAQAMPILRLGSAGESVSQVQAMLKLMGFYDGPVDGFYREQTQVAVASFQTAAGIHTDGIVGQTTWQYLLPNPDNTMAANPAGATPAEPTSEPTPAEPTPALPPEPTPVATAAPPEPTPAATPESTPVATNPAPASPTPASPAPASPAPASPAPANAPAANPPNPSVDLPVLRLGTHGPAVVRLQERLKTLGFYSGALDGVFGAGTEAAVQQMQRRHNLEDDGVVGPATWSVIFR